MAEIKKTLAILKARWPEMALIVGLYALYPLLMFFPRAQPESRWILLFSFFFVIVAQIIAAMLIYGFLRTVYLEGERRQPPLVLLRVGKHFFWRMLGFGLLFGIALWILALLLFLVTKQFTSIQVCFGLVTLILIKPLLFIPALIIVLDCGLFKSFKFLKRCRLAEAKELLVLFFISMGLTFLWGFLPRPSVLAPASDNLLAIVLTVAGCFIWLIIWITAVRFVSSLDLVYDSSQISSDSEDSPGE